MTKLNPTAINLWIFTSSVGYLVSPTVEGVVFGLATGTGLSLIASFLPGR